MEEKKKKNKINFKGKKNCILKKNKKQKTNVLEAEKE